MKKYLLLILTMLSVSIGTWADPTEFGTREAEDETPKSTWEKNGTLVTITINVESDVTADWALPTGLTLDGVNTVKVITGSGVTLHGAYNNGLHHLWCLYNSVVLDLSEAVVAYTNVTINNVVTPTLEMAQGDNLKNLVVPNGHASDPQTVLISNVYYSPTTYDSNNYGISETTVNASLKLTSNLTALSNISSSAKKMKVLHDLPNAIDFSGVLTSSQTLDLTNVTTTGTIDTNPITVEGGVKVVCISDGVKSRIKGTDANNITVANPIISCTAENLDDELDNLVKAGVAPTSITITSSETALTAEQMAHFGTLNGLTYLSLEADAGTNIASLVLPSSLEKLTLPRSSTNPESLVTSAMKTHSNLLYVYAPYSGDQNANQTVADYVWVKAGGLWQAMHNEARLKTAVYVKVASDVANGVQLNELDAKFGDHGIMAQTSYNTENYPWQYIDLSETFFGVAATNANTAPHDKGYRIILPDNLTGDNMALFASKPTADISDDPDRGYRGIPAAVYSYKGTTLSIMEITDATYHTNALADSRIVRSGTTEIKVISGSYGGTTFSKLGPNLLAAINAADDTPDNNTTNHITKVTVAVGDGIYTEADAKVSSATTFTFDNDNLTNLDLSYTNNSYVTIDVSGCAGLTNFQMNEATMAAVNAYNSTTPLNNLATVSLGHTTVGGDVNLSGTNLATQLEVDLANITGTLDVSNTSATSFDFTKLTATKVDASNTNALTSLNINGISLNGDVFTPNDDTQKDGKIDVTRSSNNYSDLTITKADAFNATRIIPSTGGYTTISIHEAKVEITVEGNSLTDVKVDDAVSAYNAAHASDPGYTAGNKANVKVLHVTGTLTADDITYIKNNLTALQLLDLSECTADAADLIGKIPTTTAIVLPDLVPGESNTEASTIDVVKTLQDAGYECVAYYTSKTADNYRLNVYAYNGTVGNLKSTSPAIIDTNTGITFLRRYANTTLNSVEHQFTQAQPSLLTALGTLPPFSIDMTWLDISKLGTDFSGLNNDTHYLIIPQNSYAATVTRQGVVYNNDFTVENDGDANTTDYKYNDNIYAVSTYKGTAAPYATSAYFDGEAYQYGSDYGQIYNTANITYVRKPGNLGRTMSYMSNELKNADILTIVGTINNDDVAQSSGTTSLSDATNPYLDLTHATLTTSGDKAITWSDYTNNISVESIAMPYGYSSTLAGLPTVGTCDNLKGIGCLLKSDDVYESSTKKSTLVYQSYKEGGVGKIIPMLHALNLVNRAYRITSLTVGGPVNACDLANRSTGIDENGHLITSVDANNVMTVTETGYSGSLSGYAGVMDYWDLSAVTLPNYTGGDNVTSENRSYRFDNSSHTYAEGESGSFSYQNDLCFSMIGLVPDTYDPFSCKLPTDESVWRLPTDAFYNGHGMTELNLPFNYQYIGNGAFTDTYLTHITTTDAIINGNIVDNGEHTYTLSANLKEIGDNPGTGNALDANQTVFPQNREVYDVYVLATDVPKCYANAFAANVLYGWGGFKGGEFPYCRDKYINGSNWFCVLRYPYKAAWDAAHSTSGARESGFDLASRRAAPTTTPDLTTIDNYEEMEAAYTDVYKIYTKKEQTGAVDANGNAILWPTFSELQRVSAQALTNEVWYDWDTAYNGQQEVNTSSSYDGSYKKSLDTNISNHYNFEEYKGWHQFVLTQATYVESVEQNATEREYEQKGWYTFCIPYDLTEDQVYEMLGVPYSTAQYTNKVGDNRIKKSDESTEEGVIDRILPDIRTLGSVTRKPGSTNQISLLLTSNMVTTSEGVNTFYYYNINDEAPASSTLAEITETIDGKKIAIKGGYPYYIRPYLLKGDNVTNLGKYVMTRYADIFKQAASCQRNNGTVESINRSNLATLQFAKPYEEHKIQAFLDTETSPGYTTHTGTDKKYYYTFIGQFWDQKLPRYCYYTLEGTGNWYRFSNFTQENLYKWYAYKCVILVTQEVDDTEAHPQSGKFRDTDECNYPSIENGTTDKLNGTLSLAFLDGIDDYDFANSARECIFLFDEDIMDLGDGSQTTAIESLDGENIVPSTQGKVYNMAGQHVGNSLEGLSKGMYIVNGKKYVIK